MYYSATIVKQAGIQSDYVAIWIAAAIAFLNFAFTLVGLYFVERSGRRKLLLISLGGCVFALVALGLAFKLGDLHDPHVASSVAPCSFSSCSSCTSHSYVTAPHLRVCQPQSFLICPFHRHCGFCEHPLVATGLAGPTCVPGNGTHHSDKPTQLCSSGWAYDYCPNPYAWLAVLSLSVYIMFFAPGMGPLPWTVNSEIYPPAHRSFGNRSAVLRCLALVSCTLCTTLTHLLLPPNESALRRLSM